MRIDNEGQGTHVESVREVIEWVALSIEMLAVVVIVGAIVVATTPSGMLRTRSRLERGDAFSAYKQRMGRGLLLGLELLLAADIIGTVALAPTLQSLGTLGLLALIRSFLSWSLDVEIDGCWPWQARASAHAAEASQAQAHPAEAASRE
jgi:uncharacterized membrane protein